jgi:hypothetical protein
LEEKNFIISWTSPGSVLKGQDKKYYCKSDSQVSRHGLVPPGKPEGNEGNDDSACSVTSPIVYYAPKKFKKIL